jgi:thiol-disulfide isomerase/thioredoxin
VFITKTYKTHRENVLLDREKCLLPATQPYVIVEKEREKILNEAKKIEKYRLDLLMLIRESDQQIRDLDHRSRTLNADNVTVDSETVAKKFVRKCPISECRGFLSSRWKCGTCETNICNKCNERREDNDHVCDPANVETMNLLNKDTKPCPSCGTMISKISGCFEENTEIMLWNGTTKFVQDIIPGDVLVGDDGNRRIVQDTVSGMDILYEIQQTNGINYTVNSKHTLVLKKNGIVLEMLTEDFYNSPEKHLYYGFKTDGSTTSLQISTKGSGKYFGFLLDENHRFVGKDLTVLKNCDQMWCPDCQTAFSWNKGTIEAGTVHNPHYYEFMRRQNGGVAPRNHGDIPCGGLPDVYSFQRAIGNQRRGVPRDQQIVLMNIMQVINHILHVDRVLVEMRNHRNDDTQLVNRGLRVDYLLHRITDDNFKQTLQQNEKAREKKREFLNIYQMFCDVGSDIFRQIMADKTLLVEYIAEQVTVLKNLVQYFNENLKTVGKIYKCVYPGISHEYIWVHNLETSIRRAQENVI